MTHRLNSIPASRSHRLFVASRRFAVTVVAVIYSGLMIATQACSKPSSKKPLLTSGRPIAAKIEGTEKQAYELRLAAGRYLHLTIEQKGLDVEATLIPPTGEAIKINNAGSTTGAEQIFADAPGDYRLEIERKQPKTGGDYEISLNEPPNENGRGSLFVAAQSNVVKGQAGLKQKDRQKAIAQFEEALGRWRAGGEILEQLHTLHELGSMHFNAGAFELAKQKYQEELELSGKTGNRTMEALALNGLGLVYDKQIEKSQAEKAYKSALEISQQIGDRDIEANVLNNFASLHKSVGEYQSALIYYLQALPLWQALGDTARETNAISNLGTLYRTLGDKQKALFYQESALKLARADDKQQQAQALNGRGMAYYALGDENELNNALSDFQQALALAREAKSEEGEAVILGNLGATEDSIGKNKEVPKYLKESLRLKKEARKHLQESLKLRRQSKDRFGEANTRTKLGLVYNSLGDRRNARKHLEQALEISHQIGDRYQEATVLAALARVARDGGDLTQARAKIEQALQIIEDLRVRISNPDARTSFYAAQQQYYEFLTDLLMRLHRQRPRSGFDKQGFLNNEKARARALRETLIEARVEIEHGIDKELLTRRRDLKKKLYAKTAEQTRLLSGADGVTPTLALSQELVNLNQQYDQVEMQIRQQSSRYDELFNLKSVEMDEIQRELSDSDTVLLEFALGEKQSYLWIVTSSDFASIVLPSSRKEIEFAAQTVYQSLTAYTRTPFETDDLQAKRIATEATQMDAEYLKAATDLSRMLLAPAMERITGHRLLIVCDGKLQKVPFAALPVPKVKTATLLGTASPDIASLHPLVLDYEVVNLPSASTLVDLRRERAAHTRAPKSIAFLVDPVINATDDRRLSSTRTAPPQPPPPLSTLDFDSFFGNGGGNSELPRIQFTEREARFVAPESESKIFSGFDASLETVKSGELKQFRYVAFMTHGKFNDARPGYSGIALSRFNRQGGEADGVLSLEKIYNLDLPAELVVLSACESALGENVRGEGMVGVARGFLTAGTERVVGTLFTVDNQATTELMTKFYQQSLRSGSSPAAALRFAQKALLSDPVRRSPYYWAGFILIGEPL